MKKTTFLNSLYSRYPIVSGVISAIACIELLSFGFNLMNVEDTFVFYIGLIISLSVFFAIGFLAYKLSLSIINSIKNK